MKSPIKYKLLDDQRKWLLSLESSASHESIYLIHNTINSVLSKGYYTPIEKLTINEFIKLIKKGDIK